MEDNRTRYPNERSLNTISDELLSRQSMPSDVFDSDIRFQGVLAGTIRDYTGDMAPDALRPHLFQEAIIDSIDLRKVSTIPRYCFAEMGDGISTLDLQNVEIIEPYAFWHSEYITDIINTNNVTSLGQNENLEPYCIKDYEGNVFVGTKIKKLIFPQIIDVADYCFQEMPELEYVSFSTTGDVTVGINAFNNCKKLNTVRGRITTIKEGGFRNTTNLKKVVLNNCSEVGYEAFHSSGVEEVYLYGPSAVIGQYAFCDCKNLVTVEIGDMIAAGAYAFANCENLVDVSIGVNYEGISLSEGMFKDSKKLKTLKLPGDFFVGEGNALPPPEELTNFVIYVPVYLLDTYKSDPLWEPYMDCFEELDYMVLVTEPDSGNHYINVGNQGDLNAKIAVIKGNLKEEEND